MPREQRTAAIKWPKRPRVTGSRLPDELVVRAKHYAIDHGKTLGELIREAVEEYLAKQAKKQG